MRAKTPYHQEQWYKVLGEEIVMTKENSRKRFVHLRARSIETKKKKKKIKRFSEDAKDIEQELTNSANMAKFSQPTNFHVWGLPFLNSYILNGYISTYMVSLILSLGPQGLNYLLTNPLKKITNS